MCLPSSASPRLRRGLAACAWLGAPTLLVSLAFAPFTSHFDALISELQARARALLGATDPAAKKQAKAVGKALAALDKPADDLVDDLRTAGKLAKSLAKAFPDEFAAEAELPPDLGELLATSLDLLGADVAAALTTAAADVAAAPDGGCKTKAQATVDKGLAEYDAVALALDLPSQAKGLRKALKLAAKASKTAGKCSPSGGGGGGSCDGTNEIQVTVDGGAFPFSDVTWFRGGDVKSLVITASNPSPFDELALVFHGVTGKGTFDVHPGSTFVQAGAQTFFAGSIYTVTGSITLDKFVYSNDQTDNDCFAGTLDVTFSNDEISRHIVGPFDVSKKIGF